MSDPTGLVDGDTATHATGVVGIIAALGGMFRAMVVAGRDREAADRERAALMAKVDALASERAILMSKVDALTSEVAKGFAKSDTELALVTQLVQQRSIAEDVLASRVDKLEERMRQVEIARASASGVYER